MSVSEKLQQMKADKAAANLQEGMDFLEKTKQNKNVVELASGLQYEILKDADGDNPLPINTVTCQYHGTLIDGTIFDSSVQRGQPASFPLNMVIKGWTEGIPYFKEGGNGILLVPSALGYGSGSNNGIPGNSVLIFDVKLLQIL